MCAVAAIIPTHRRPALLQRAVRSVLAQRAPVTELIIVNDGPAADTPAIAAAVAGNSHVTVIDNRRTPGPSGARNRGAALASAEWLAFLDDDDEWLPDYIAALQRLVAEQPLDVVLSNFEVVFDDDRADGERVVPEVLEAGAFLTRNAGLIGSNFAMRREYYLALGGFDETMTSAEDMDIGIRMSLGGARYRPLHQALVRHHQHGEPRICRSRSAAMVGGIHRFYEVHRHRMTDEQRQLFVDHMRRLWDIDTLAP